MVIHFVGACLSCGELVTFLVVSGVSSFLVGLEFALLEVFSDLLRLWLSALACPALDVPCLALVINLVVFA